MHRVAFTPPFFQMNTDLKKLRSRLFLLFILCTIIGWFGKDDFKSAIPNNRVLREPVQTAITATPITFQKGGYSYTLTPLFNYDISGLVAHHYSYNRWFSLSRTDEVFTVDLCLMWGDNIRSGAYQNKSLRVSQDERFCVYSYQYGSGAPAQNSSLSNNHMVVKNPEIQKVIDSISAGDQVRIIGKLVNAKAVALGATRQYEGRQREWHTSTARNDTGAGACEIIYVENVQILSRGNVGYHVLYNVGLFGISLIAAWYFLSALFRFFFA